MAVSVQIVVAYQTLQVSDLSRNTIPDPEPMVGALACFVTQHSGEQGHNMIAVHNECSPTLHGEGLMQPGMSHSGSRLAVGCMTNKLCKDFANGNVQQQKYDNELPCSNETPQAAPKNLRCMFPLMKSPAFI